MDDHLWIDLRLFPNADDGAKYVSDRGKAPSPDEPVLRDEMGGIARFPGSILLHFCGDHVSGKTFTGKTCIAWKTEATKNKLRLSIPHSWFYPPD